MTFQPHSGPRSESPAPHGGQDPALEYPPAQDPWAGTSEPSVGSVPTETIRTGTYARPEPTEPTRVEFPGPSQRRPSSARGTSRRLILLFLVIFTLAGGTGIGIWWAVGGSTPESSSGPDEPTRTVEFDPFAEHTGDCLINQGTAAQASMKVVPCNTDNAYRVLRIVRGEKIEEEADGRSLDERSAESACAGTTYTHFYAYNDADDTRDAIYCLVAAGPDSTTPTDGASAG